jgi:aspartate oxidase
MNYRNIKSRAVSKAEKDPMETALLAGGGVIALYGVGTNNQTAVGIGVVALLTYGIFKFLS